MAYVKPQSPLKYGDINFYPLTTIDQVIKSDNTRLNENDLGMKMELLWENPNPSVIFNPVTYPIDTEYLFFVVVLKSDRTEDSYNSNICFKGIDSECIVYGSNGFRQYVRKFLFSNGTVAIRNCYGVTPAYQESASLVNDGGIPFRIYGVK